MKASPKFIALIAALLGAASIPASAQSQVLTQSLAPIASGNTVCVTRYVDGRIYAKGYTDNTFSTVSEFLSQGGLQFEWWYENHYLYIRPYFSPYAPTRFYLCPPSGSDVTLVVTVNTNAEVRTLGLSGIGTGYSFLDVFDGIIYFNDATRKYGQVQFRMQSF